MPDLGFRAPASTSAMVKAAADLDGTTVSKWLLNAAEKALRAKGFAPADQQYALVADGEFVLSPAGNVITTFRPHDDPRGTWVVIENEDAAAWIEGNNWRLKPLPLRIDGDRVVRIFPITDNPWVRA